MARPRNYRAEYAARVARNEARGLSRRAARGHARPGETTARQARRIFRDLDTATRVAGDAGRVTKSTNAAIVRAALVAAAARGDLVAILATYDKGQGPRSKYIDGPHPTVGGYPPDAGPVTSGRISGPLGAVQVIAGPAVAAGGGGGIDPRDVLDLAAYYGGGDAGLWDAIADLWDDEHS